MAFMRKIGSILRQTSSKFPSFESSASSASIFHAVRCFSSKLFVGGLSYATDENSLRETFTPYGNVVEARIIVDRESGRSRGFGFISYESSEEASAAIQALDGRDLHGRFIKVSHATDQGGTSRGSRFSGGAVGNLTGGGFGSGGGFNNYGHSNASGYEGICGQPNEGTNYSAPNNEYLSHNGVNVPSTPGSDHGRPLPGFSNTNGSNYNATDSGFGNHAPPYVGNFPPSSSSSGRANNFNNTTSCDSMGQGQGYGGDWQNHNTDVAAGNNGGWNDDPRYYNANTRRG